MIAWFVVSIRLPRRTPRPIDWSKTGSDHVQNLLLAQLTQRMKGDTK